MSKQIRPLAIAVIAAVLLHQFSTIFAVLPSDYQSKSAAEKQQILWDQIQTNPYESDALPISGHSFLQMSVLAAYAHHLPSFNFEADEMPEGRLKLFHPYGSCAKATLTMFSSSIYTGIFKADTQSRLIIRPSLGSADFSKISPGMGVKVLIDNEPSQNFHTIFTTDGQGSNKNFFENSVSNHFTAPIPLPNQMPIVRAMEMALTLLPGGIAGRPEEPNNLGLVEQASQESNGNQVPETEVVAPWKIEFVPNKAFSVPADSPDDFRVQLSRVPVGSVLYSVVLHRSPEDYASGVAGVLAGEVVVDSDLIATKYCDETLFMRHARKRWHA